MGIERVHEIVWYGGLGMYFGHCQGLCTHLAIYDRFGSI